MAVVIRKMLPTDLQPAMSLLAQYNMAPTPERADLSADRAETASLAVDPAFRGQGVGARLQIARLRELKQSGVRWVRTESDRPETLAWYIRKFGYVEVGKNPKKHEFSLPDVADWTVLELDLTTLDLARFDSH